PTLPSSFACVAEPGRITSRAEPWGSRNWTERVRGPAISGRGSNLPEALGGRSLLHSQGTRLFGREPRPARPARREGSQDASRNLRRAPPPAKRRVPRHIRRSR